MLFFVFFFLPFVPFGIPKVWFLSREVWMRWRNSSRGCGKFRPSPPDPAKLVRQCRARKDGGIVAVVLARVVNLLALRGGVVEEGM